MPRNIFSQARKIFKDFKTEFEGDTDLREEFEDAIQYLLVTYNTTIHENRFVVGGVVEYIIVAAINGTEKLAATHVGKFNPRTDIDIQYEKGVQKAVGFSVKGAFTRGASIRLVNVLGEGVSVMTWEEPTLFVLSDVGIVYGDRELIPDAASPLGDALVLQRRPLNEFIKESRDQYVIETAVPYKPTGEDLSEAKTASEEVAREIIQKYKRLKME